MEEDKGEYVKENWSKRKVCCFLHGTEGFGGDVASPTITELYPV
jgi:hypothetical protein